MTGSFTYPQWQEAFPLNPRAAALFNCMNRPDFGESQWATRVGQSLTDMDGVKQEVVGFTNHDPRVVDPDLVYQCVDWQHTASERP